MVPGFPMTVVTRFVDFVNTIATKTRLPVQQVVEWSRARSWQVLRLAQAVREGE